MPYITRSRHGVWKYRRVIPEPLRPAAGKREVLKSLRTKDEREAEKLSLRVHMETEAWLKAIRVGGINQELVSETIISEYSEIDMWIRGQSFLRSIGLPYKDLRELAKNDPELEQRQDITRLQCGIETDDPDNRDYELAHSPEAQAVMGILRRPDPTLAEALTVYLRVKASEIESKAPSDGRKWVAEKKRCITYLAEAVGEAQTVTSLQLEDVRKFEASLQTRGLKPGSISKVFKLCRAIIETSLREFDIHKRNPFERYSINNPVPARQRRLPLTDAEAETFLSLSINSELSTIARLLVLTGARLAEISGLAWADIVSLDGPSPHLEIRPNDHRPLKTKASHRVVPLLPYATSILQEYSRTAQDAQGAPSSSAPVFPRYGRDNGPAAASAALSKALRATGITDKKKTAHSVRQYVKQRLRDTGCPKPISDNIQGHASASVSDSYGLGTALEMMHRHLKAAVGHLRVEATV